MRRKCSIVGCEKEAKRGGLCWTHEFSQRYKTNRQFRENRNKTKRGYNQRLLQRYRDKIADALGGWKCSGFGNTEKGVLAFDHKDGGGEYERNKMGGQLPTIRYYFHNIEEAKERLRVLCANCNWKMNALERYGRGASRTAGWLRTTREELIEVLGGHRCLNCGVRDISVLTIDHIDGGGTKERRLMGGYLQMIQHYSTHTEAARQKLQVLCRNCNWKRHLVRSGLVG